MEKKEEIYTVNQLSRLNQLQEHVALSQYENGKMVAFLLRIPGYGDIVMKKMEGEKGITLFNKKEFRAMPKEFQVRFFNVVKNYDSIRKSNSMEDLFNYLNKEL